MESKQLSYFEKGNFVEIDNSFISESTMELDKISKIQKKYDKTDTDTFINEVRDSIVCSYLNYDLINIEN